MIRLAEVKDVPRIVQLGSRSLVDGPYRGILADNPKQTAIFTRQVVENIGKVLLWEEDGKVTGLLAFIVCDHYLTGEKVAEELMWYVEPEARAGCPALRLLWAAQDMAKEMGAKKMKFTAPNNDVGRLYERFGYHQIEAVFLKEL